MARRNNGLIDAIGDVLMIGPIWLGPVLAAAVAVAGWFVLPGVFSSLSDRIPLHVSLVPLIRNGSLILAGGILVMWLVSLVKRSAARRTFDSHASRDSVGNLSWRQFEGYVGEAFRREGYHVEQTGDPAGDGGIDLVLRKDGEVTLVQCKHWKARSVGVKPVRELLGVMAGEGAQAAVLATSGGFTAEAIAFARANRIRLIDGDALAALVQSVGSNGQAAPPASPVAAPATPVAAEAASSAPSCPKCGARMVLRTARKGAAAGSRFWGCQAYPRCRGTRPA